MLKEYWCSFLVEERVSGKETFKSRPERLVEVTKEGGVRVRLKELVNLFIFKASFYFTDLYSY